MADTDKVSKLMYLGLTEQKAHETLKNEILTGALIDSAVQVRKLSHYLHHVV